MNLTKQENSLIAESEPHSLDRMDEESLKELQNRLRRARDKHFTLLRRQGAARVEAERSRGAANPPTNAPKKRWRYSTRRLPGYTSASTASSTRSVASPRLAPTENAASVRKLRA